MGWSHQNRPCEGESSAGALRFSEESSAGALRFSEESASTESSASHHPFSPDMVRPGGASLERLARLLGRLRLRRARKLRGLDPRGHSPATDEPTLQGWHLLSGSWENSNLWEYPTGWHSQ